MPYKRVGNEVYVKRGGKWNRKATAKSAESANRMIRLLKSKPKPKDYG